MAGSELEVTLKMSSVTFPINCLKAPAPTACRLQQFPCLCLHASSDRELTTYRGRPCQLWMVPIIRILACMELKPPPCIFHLCCPPGVPVSPPGPPFSGGIIFARLGANLWVPYHRWTLFTLPLGGAISSLTLGIIAQSMQHVLALAWCHLTPVD